MEMGSFGLLNELCYIVPCLFIYLNVNYKARFPVFFPRSARLLACFALMTVSLIQGELGGLPKAIQNIEFQFNTE